MSFIFISIPPARADTTVTVGCGNSYYNYPRQNGTSAMDYSTTCTYPGSSTWNFGGIGSIRHGAIGSPCNYTETFCTCGADMILCTCRNRGDNGCADFSDWEKTVEACDVTITASPAGISPNLPGNATPPTSRISVVLNRAAPAGGCAVILSVEPTAMSGGHTHNTNRPRGSLRTNTFTFTAGTTGTRNTDYMSGAFSGVEQIRATVNGTNVNGTTVNVQVAGLAELEASADRHWSLTGETATHLRNHYGTAVTLTRVRTMADNYFNRYHAALGINDISLEWGGLFDWDVTNTPWTTPHRLHRIGTSVDIDTCANDTTAGSTRTCINHNGVTVNGAIPVDRDVIRRLCADSGGHLVNEATFHCEFP